MRSLRPGHEHNSEEWVIVMNVELNEAFLVGFFVLFLSVVLWELRGEGSQLGSVGPGRPGSGTHASCILEPEKMLFARLGRGSSRWPSLCDGPELTKALGSSEHLCRDRAVRNPGSL